MADNQERNEREKNGGSKRQPVVPVGGPPIDPRVRIGVDDPNDKEVDEKAVTEGVAHGLDQIAQKMAAGAGNTPEERAALATEIEGLKQTAEDKGVTVPQLDALVSDLREARPVDAYIRDPKAEAHALAVQKVAAARDEINASLYETAPAKRGKR